MPTANEYRLQAQQCQELANRANEFYVKNALIELERALATSQHQDRSDDDAFITAVRQTDLLLRHTHSDVGAGSLSPLRRH